MEHVRSDKNLEFKQLLETHHDKLYWMIRRIIIAHHDAEDVLQNTWIKIHKGLPGFQGKSSIKTWMYRIAYNESMRFLSKKRKNLPLDEVDHKYLETLQNDVYYSSTDLTQKLHQALATLTEKERQIFNLKYYEAFKFTMISNILGMNINSVKTIYYRAEQKMKQKLVQ